MNGEQTLNTDDPKNIIVRNAAGQTRRAHKRELKWFADRGWLPVEEVRAAAVRGQKESGTEKVKI